MSLILDALKKAEQDRHAGQAPALDELLVRPPTIRQLRRDPQREMLMVAGITAAVLFALAGLTYLFWPAANAPAVVASAPVATEAAEPASAEPASAEPAPALRIDPERLAPPVTDIPEDAVDLADTGAAQAMTMDELDGDTPQASPTKPPSTSPPAPPTVAAQPLEPLAPPAPAATSVAAVPLPPSPTVTESPAPAPPAPEPAGARPLKEMPSSFRSEFPKLTVDVHVYNDNPLRRFALINGKKYRETDTLVEGPRVVEITPTGVVLEHRGSKVLLELPR